MTAANAPLPQNCDRPAHPGRAQTGSPGEGRGESPGQEQAQGQAQEQAQGQGEIPGPGPDRAPRRGRGSGRARDVGPPRTGPDERATLLGFLDHLRDALAAKVADVPEPQVREAGVPSGTSLLGLLKHLVAVERFSFLGEDILDLRATMRPSPEDTVAGLLAEYRRTIERANEVVDACPDLALPAPRPPRRGAAPSMRWVLVHMIEETGRHAGHADILRERIDGSTGR